MGQAVRCYPTFYAPPLPFRPFIPMILPRPMNKRIKGYSGYGSDSLSLSHASRPLNPRKQLYINLFGDEQLLPSLQTIKHI